MRTRTRAKLGAAALAVTMLAAACGDDDGSASTEPEDESTDQVTEEGETDAEEPAAEESADDEATEEEPMDDESMDESTDGATATVDVAETSLGAVLVDAEGFTLYAFTPDAQGAPTCEGGCAGTWPPALVDGTPAGSDAVLGAVATATHPDGGEQVTVNGWPLYRYAADAAPGDVNGQGVGDVWFAVSPDGSPLS